MLQYRLDEEFAVALCSAIEKAEGGNHSIATIEQMRKLSPKEKADAEVGAGVGLMAGGGCTETAEARTDGGAGCGGHLVLSCAMPGGVGWIASAT